MSRLLEGVLTIWLAVTIVFFALRIVPGDAITSQLEQGGAGQAEIAEIRATLGLDQPFMQQYVDYMLNLLKGDLGVSLMSYQPVDELILDSLQSTTLLAGLAMLFATTFGILLGVAAAFDQILANQLINLSLGAPIYWTGTLMIMVFAVQLSWLPSSGSSRLEHLVMPVLVLGFHTMGTIAQVVRANVDEVRHAPYVTVARSKGLSNADVLRRHILKAALLPVMTVIALQTGFLLSGTVITESLFGWSGLGRLLLQSTVNQDYPVVQGVVMVSAAFYSLLLTAATHIHRWIDPRLAV